MDLVEDERGNEVSTFTMHFKDSSQNLCLSCDDRDQFVYVFDGLRCLSGMDMITREMQVLTATST